MGKPEITVLDAYPDADWNAYVDQHPRGRFFHRSEWGAVYRALGWIEPCFLAACRAGRIVGVLPLAAVRWAPGRRVLVSAPYCVEAGALADDAETASALEAAAVGHGRALGCRSLELRSAGDLGAGWLADEGFATFCRTISADDDSNLKAIPRKQRAVIRKGEAAGLQVSDDLAPEAFYRLYATSMRNLGTPAYGRDLFAALRAAFGERVTTLAIADDEGPVAAVMSFHYKQRVMPYYAGALPRARRCHANDFMYWALMKEAARSGHTEFDFGRSVAGTGAWAFKRHWGFEPEPLVYRHAALNGTPPAPLDPDSAFNRLARRAWTRLPFAVATALGPCVARRLY